MLTGHYHSDFWVCMTMAGHEYRFALARILGLEPERAAEAKRTSERYLNQAIGFCSR